MKKIMLMLLAGGIFIGISLDVKAQQRRGGDHGDRQNNHANRQNNGHDHGRSNDHHERRGSGNGHGHYHHYRHKQNQSRHHGYDRYCERPPVAVHHYHRRSPRYVYYRDYNVYYDCHREVYITYSGRNWTMSTSIPVGMTRIDITRVHRLGVDYYEDDFPRYLETKRPSYVQVSAEW
jgi:hypothetical protein